MTPFIGAGALVTDAADRILLVMETSGVKRGKWSLPAGKVEAGESIVAAAMRETNEETGLVIDPVDVLGFYHSVATVEGVYGLNVVIRANVSGGNVSVSSEHPDVRFIDRPVIDSMIADEVFRSSELVRLVLADLDAGASFPLSTIRTLGES